MPTSMKVETGCHFLGEILEEVEVPVDLKVARGEPVRPRLLPEVIEELEIAFTVLLKDGRTAIVHGHHLHHERATDSGLEVFSVYQRTQETDRVVAVFNSTEVAGIFHGDLRESRLSA